MTQQLNVQADVSQVPYQYDFGGNLSLNVLIVNLSKTDALLVRYAPEAEAFNSQETVAPMGQILLQNDFLRFLRASDATAPPTVPCNVVIIAAWPEIPGYDRTSTTLTQNEAVIRSVTQNVPTIIAVDSVGLLKDAKLPVALNLDAGGNLGLGLPIGAIDPRAIRALTATDTPKLASVIAADATDPRAIRALTASDQISEQNILGRIPHALSQDANGNLGLGLPTGAIDPRAIRALTATDTPKLASVVAADATDPRQIRALTATDTPKLASVVAADATDPRQIRALGASDSPDTTVNQIGSHKTDIGQLGTYAKDATVATPNQLQLNQQEAGNGPGQLQGSRTNVRTYNPWGFNILTDVTPRPSWGSSTTFCNVQRTGARGYPTFYFLIETFTTQTAITVYLYRHLPESPTAVPDMQFTIPAASMPGVGIRTWITWSPNIWWPYDQMVVIPQSQGGPLTVNQSVVIVPETFNEIDSHYWGGSTWSPYDDGLVCFWDIIDAAPSAMPVLVEGGSVSIRKPARVYQVLTYYTSGGTGTGSWSGNVTLPVDCLITFRMAIQSANPTQTAGFSFTFGGVTQVIIVYGDAATSPCEGSFILPRGTVLTFSNGTSSLTIAISLWMTIQEAV